MNESAPVAGGNRQKILKAAAIGGAVLLAMFIAALSVSFYLKFTKSNPISQRQVVTASPGTKFATGFSAGFIKKINPNTKEIIANVSIPRVVEKGTAPSSAKSEVSEVREFVLKVTDQTVLRRGKVERGNPEPTPITFAELRINDFIEIKFYGDIIVDKPAVLPLIFLNVVDLKPIAQ